MKHLIVYAHPNIASFNHAIKETLVRVLKGKGQDVRVRDLYALHFDPVLKADDFQTFLFNAAEKHFTDGFCFDFNIYGNFVII